MGQKLMPDERVLDPRLNAYRDDLADERLQGRVAATRYIPGDEAHVHLDRVPLFNAPSFDGELQTEALHGEGLRIFEIRDGWAWGQLLNDDYVGYMPLEGLSPGFMPPSHRVRALRTFIYTDANLKSPPVDMISMMSQVTVSGEQGEFFEIEGGGFVFKAHLAAINQYEPDFVVTATRFLGTPYLWGGRTSLGLDCSALIQISLMASGIGCRRDSDMQAAGLGQLLADTNDLSQLHRGDFVFWRGHIGVMVDEMRFLHANAHHMEVAIEPLVVAIERIRGNGGGEITALRRLAAARV